MYVCLPLQTIFYPAISLQALSLWNCQLVGHMSYLTSDLSVPCSGARYTTASTFNAAFVLCVVIGWPCFILWCDIRMGHGEGAKRDGCYLVMGNELCVLYRGLVV